MVVAGKVNANVTTSNKPHDGSALLRPKLPGGNFIMRLDVGVNLLGDINMVANLYCIAPEERRE